MTAPATDITVRPALLDDTAAISALFRARIGVWQRMDARGQVESLPYEALSLYERWTHGGPWMSVETGAVLLSRLLRGVGVALVAERGGEVMGYAEAYPGDEPPPFGAHLHIAQIISAGDDSATSDALLSHLATLAGQFSGRRLTVAVSGADDPALPLYEQHGFTALTQVQRYMLPARTGQSFYKALDHFASGVDQIRGWHMSIGRAENAAQHWETLWPRIWEVIPQLAARRTHRLRLTASGHEAFLCCVQQPYAARSADLYCWSPKPLTAQLLTAIRDWAHRENYRTLALIVSPETARILGTDAEADPYTRQTFALRV